MGGKVAPAGDNNEHVIYPQPQHQKGQNAVDGPINQPAPRTQAEGDQHRHERGEQPQQGQNWLRDHKSSKLL